MKEDSIEDLLVEKSPLGWPASGYYVGVEFEAGGAYETWGWVLKAKDKIVLENRNLKDFLKEARLFIETQMSANKEEE